MGTVNVNSGLVNVDLRGERFFGGLEYREDRGLSGFVLGGFVDGGFFSGGVVFEHLLEELGDGAFSLCGLSDFGGWSEDA